MRDSAKNLIRAVAAHFDLDSDHEFDGRDHDVAVKKLGELVLDCNAERAAYSNKLYREALDQGYYMHHKGHHTLFRPRKSKKSKKKEKDSSSAPKRPKRTLGPGAKPGRRPRPDAHATRHPRPRDLKHKSIKNTAEVDAGVPVARRFVVPREATRSSPRVFQDVYVDSSDDSDDTPLAITRHHRGRGVSSAVVEDSDDEPLATARRHHDIPSVQTRKVEEDSEIVRDMISDALYKDSKPVNTMLTTVLHQAETKNRTERSSSCIVAAQVAAQMVAQAATYQPLGHTSTHLQADMSASAQRSVPGLEHINPSDMTGLIVGRIIGEDKQDMTFEYELMSGPSSSDEWYPGPDDSE